MDLKNKTVIITGASSGIGKATARAFAKEGAHTVLAARSIDKLQDLRKEIGGICVHTDITKEHDIKHLFNETENMYGKIDILINNAGRGLRADLCSIDVHDWENLFATNVTGVFLCTKEAVTRMQHKQVNGHIITVSSIAGLFGAPNYAAYCASKHAVSGFKKALTWEVKPVKITTLHPGRINTAFFNNYTRKPKRNQLLNPEDIADVIIAHAKRNIMLVWYYRTRNFVKRIYYFFRYLL